MEGRSLDELVASIHRLHSEAVARNAALHRELEAKQSELECETEKHKASELQHHTAASHLQEQSSLLQQQLAHKAEAINTLESRIESLQQDASQASSARAQDVEEASQDLLTLEAQLSAEKQKVTELQSQLALHAASVAAMQERHDIALQLKEEEVERLREEQSQAADSVDEWKADLERLEDARTREIGLIHTDLKQRDGQLAELRAAMEVAAQEKADERERREELETDVKVLTEERQRTAEQAQGHIDAMQADHEQKTTALESQLTTVQQQLTERSAEAEGARLRLEQLQQAQGGEVQQLSSTLKAESQRVLDLESRMAVLQGEKAALAERLQSVEAELQQHADSSAAKRVEADGELHRLQARIDGLLQSQLQSQAEAEAAKVQSSDLQSRIVISEETVQTLQNRIAAFELESGRQQNANGAQVEEWARERSALTERLLSAQAEFQQQATATETTKTEADGELRRRQVRIDELLHSQQQVLADGEAAQTHAAELRRQITASEETVRTLQSRIAALEQDGGRQQSAGAAQAAEWAVERSAFQSQVDAKTAEIDRVKEEHRVAHVQTAELVTQTQRSSTDRLQRLTEAKAEVEAQLQATEAELTAVRTQLLDLQNTEEQYTVDREASRITEEVLTAQLTSMQADLTRASSDHSQSSNQAEGMMQELHEESQRVAAEREQLVQEKAALQLQVSALTDRIQTAANETGMKAEVEGKLLMTEAELSAVRVELLELQQTVAHHTAHQQVSRSNEEVLTAQLTSMQADLDRVTSDHSQSSIQAEGMMQELHDNSQRIVAEREQLAQQNAALQLQVSALTDRIQSAISDAETKAQVEEHLQAAQFQLTTVRAQLLELQQAAVHHTADQQASRSSEAVMAAQLASTQADLVRVSSEHSQSSLQAEVIMEELHEASQRVAAEREQLVQQNTALQLQIASLNTRLEDAAGAAEEAMSAQLNSMQADLARATSDYSQSSTQAETIMHELHAESQRVAAEREQLIEEKTALRLQISVLTNRLEASAGSAQHDEEYEAKLERVIESEVAWREKAQRLAQLVMTNEEAVAEFRLTIQRSEEALASLRASHAAIEGEVFHLRSLLQSKDSQLQLYEERVQQQRETVDRLQLEAQEAESKAEAAPGREEEEGVTHLLRVELKDERRKTAALQDIVAQAGLTPTTGRRRTNDRALSLPSLPRITLTTMRAEPAVLKADVSAAGEGGAGVAVGGSHPLYVATEELRQCMVELKTSYGDCVESKRALAQSTATEVEAMRDELREWRKEEWERVRAVDRVKRRMKRHEGWHEAQAFHGQAPAAGCSVM